MSSTAPASPRRLPLGALLSFCLGAIVWSQVCGGAIEVELLSPSPRLGILSLYLAPLLILPLALALRRHGLALGAFLGALLPCFAALPTADARALQVGADALTLALSVVAFALFTARLSPPAVAPSAQPATLTRAPAPLDRRFWRVARLALPRLALALAFFTLPLLALYSARGQAQLRASFPNRPSDAAFLIHLVHLLIASAATYTALLSPSINRTLDAYELREAGRATRAPAHAKRARLSLTLCALALPPLAVVWWWLS